MRFAILCRVSTEGQEKEGVSLEVQQKTLSKCVESLNGIITKEYIGQESAMGKKDRPIFEELLSDCSRGIFDAVMVWDLSRWSRNPEKGRYGLAILKKNGIKLFIQSQEYNLSNPETDLIVGILNELNSFTVNLQTKKAMSSKIELARRGFPMTTSPYGRRLVSQDKSVKAVWEVIPEYKQQAEKIYNLYVEQGVATEKIAEMLGTDSSSVRKILFKYSGTEWIQKVHYENRDEIIITKIPPLLTDEQIQKAKHTARTNKQFNARKFQYLLGGKIKCGVCGTTFIGMTTNVGNKLRRYYSHSNRFRTDICIKNIQVPLIETAVLKSLSDLFSSTKNLKLAIENAIGVSRDRKEVLISKIEECNKDLNRLEKEKVRLVQAVKKGIFEDADISKDMSEIRVDTIECEERKKAFSNQLKSLLIDVPDDLHLRIQRYYKQLCNEEGSISEWHQDSQQRLLDWFFGISKENGVFILKNESGLAFNIAGALGGSLVGLIEGEYLGTQLIGIDAIEQSFASDQLVDFQRIIQDLDFESNSQASAR